MRPSPYGCQPNSKDYGKNSSKSGGKGSKDYGKNSSDSGGKGSKDYGMNSSGKGDRFAELQKCFDTMSDRIVDLQRTCEKLKLENDRLKEDYHALLESERHLEVENEIMTMENNRLQTEKNEIMTMENKRLQTENNRLTVLQTEICRLQRLQLEVDPMQSSLQPKVDRLQTEILQSEPLRQHTDTVWLQATDKLQAEVDRLQIEFDCMVAANKRLRHGITQHAEQASKLKDSLNELAYPYAYPYATIR